MLGYSTTQQPEAAGTPDFDLQGHRGARGEFPEHTMAGFDAAVAAGATTLELDLHYTKDQKFVLFHDHRIESSNATGPYAKQYFGKAVYDLTSDEMRKLDIGSLRNPDFPLQNSTGETPPLFLDEWIEAIHVKSETNARWNHIQFNIEIKIAEDSTNQQNMENLVLQLLNVLEDGKIKDRTTVQSFYLPALETVQRLDPTLPTAALFSTTRIQALFMKLGFNHQRQQILDQTLELGADIISPHFIYCSKSFIEKCHEAGLKVIPWTVNEAKTSMKLINFGVDGIITDYPTRTKAIISQIKTQ